jgi:hypothetical protein
MTFLSPWWLLGLVLVPALLLWGLLAPRGRPVTVGSLLLWRRALAGGATGRPTARLRLRDRLLWLDASCILFVLLACARPAFDTARPLEPVATVVLDRTASMQMPSSGLEGLRWKDAHRMLAGVLAEAGSAPVRVVQVPRPAGAGMAETQPARQVVAWLDAKRDPRLAEGDASRVASDEGVRRPGLPVIVATDIAPAGSLPDNVCVVAPGGPSRNAGLERLAARVEDGRWWLLVSARALAETPGEVGLEVSTEATVHATRSDFLAPGGTAETVLSLEGRPPARLRVRLTGSRDAFPADNEAFLVLEPSGVVVQILGTPPGTSLRRAFESAGATVLTASGDAAMASTDRAELLVVYGGALPEGWTGPAVTIAPPEAGGPVRPGQGTVAPEWTVAADHSLAGALYLPPPRLTEVPRYAPEPAAQVLVGTPEAPLIVTWETESARRLAVCFGLEDETTDWPRRAGFPVFWARALEWLVPVAKREPKYQTYAPMEPLPGTDRSAPGEAGFHTMDGRTVGVSFIGTDEGFQAGPGRDDSAAAVAAIRRSIEQRREATLAAAWPYAAALALLALVARAWVAR